MEIAESVHGRSYPAITASVPQARRDVSEFAGAAGVRGADLDAVRLAASEALTNVVVHAYHGGSGMIHVSVAVASEELWVLVGDDGSGLHARTDSQGLGVGLALIAEVTDGFAVVERSSGGTEIRMCFAIEPARPVREVYERGSAASAARPVSSIFSTTT
jgi:anti-sigma regulatory factor (Ser/Thr protein kinase)